VADQIEKSLRKIFVHPEEVIVAKRKAVKKAHSLSWGPCPCGCGTAIIELLDASRDVFAKAFVDRADLLRMASAMCAIAEHPLPTQRQLAS
jgi:hypothetical protein